MRLFLLTAMTMTAFAANSVLARLALADGAIDPASYTLVRIACGAAILALITRLLRERRPEAISPWRAGNFISAFGLFAYAAGFSFAYLALDTGTGALILFACVQATMIGWSISRGERPLALEWSGLVAAFGAFVWLLSPGLTAPEPLGAALMASAGVAWGIYSLRGRKSPDPLAATGGNFLMAVPLAVALSVIAYASLNTSPFGLLMAALSGAIASGMGYALWYTVLKQLSGTQAAIVQLTVPVIAAAGGFALRGEPVTMRFVLSASIILGGVAVAILARKYRR